MPIEGEYVPGTLSWAADQVELYERTVGAEGNDLLERLGSDPRLHLEPDELAGILADPIDFVGAAPRQVAQVVARIEALVSRSETARPAEPTTGRRWPWVVAVGALLLASPVHHLAEHVLEALIRSMVGLDLLS